MSPWWWLVVPVLVTAAAWVLVTWRGRPRGPGQPQDTITEHERFRTALSAGVAPPSELRGVTLRTAPVEGTPPTDRAADR